MFWGKKWSLRGKKIDETVPVQAIASAANFALLNNTIVGNSTFVSDLNHVRVLYPD